ncbi:unnamed protein product, partial [Mesorhabditis spiculigera]
MWTPFGINRFHFLLLVTWQFTMYFASQMIFSIFANYYPRWQQPDTLAYTKDCGVYNMYNGTTVALEPPAYSSAALEFHWICQTEYFQTFFSQAVFAGVLLGTFSFGTISDAFGRKPIAGFALCLGATMNFLMALAPNIYLLLLVRFFMGLSIGGSLVVVCTYVMEMLEPQQRMALRAFINWGVARLMLTIVCYEFPDWRTSSMINAAMVTPAILLVVFLFPESPNWLHHKNKNEQLVQSEKKIAKLAGIPYTPGVHRPVERSKNFFEMLKTGGLKKRLAVLWTMWFSASICGYATDLNSSTILGDLYWNQVVFSVLIAVSKMVLVVVDANFAWFTRRRLHQGSQAVVCVCFLILTIMTVFNLYLDSIAFLVINVIGTVFIEYTWDACYLCAVESIETSSRASATGSCSFVARIGALIAPVLKLLNQKWAPSLYLIVTVVGTINLIVSYTLLIETKNVDLDRVTSGGHTAEESPMLEKEGKKDVE